MIQLISNRFGIIHLRDGHLDFQQEMSVIDCSESINEAFATQIGPTRTRGLLEFIASEQIDLSIIDEGVDEIWFYREPGTFIRFTGITFTGYWVDNLPEERQRVSVDFRAENISYEIDHRTIESPQQPAGRHNFSAVILRAGTMPNGYEVSNEVLQKLAAEDIEVPIYPSGRSEELPVGVLRQTTKIGHDLVGFMEVSNEEVMRRIQASEVFFSPTMETNSEGNCRILQMNLVSSPVLPPVAKEKPKEEVYCPFCGSTNIRQPLPPMKLYRCEDCKRNVLEENVKRRKKLDDEDTGRKLRF